jgi:tetratricopeptide (TPR) repeat protein
MSLEREIFEAAVDLPDADRSTFLDQACAEHPTLRERVADLLRAHLEAPLFMERSSPAPTPPSASPAQGTAQEGVGSRYRLLEPLGEGGFGVVHLAEQLEPVQRQVAVKVLKPGMDSRQVVARFDAERQVLARLEHPNIARVFDAGTTDSGRPFFAMELVRGVPITQFADDHQASLEERISLFLAVCSAIHHAHQKGILHRDIKPSNVLVTRPDPAAPGIPKVIDFGIAKALQPGPMDPWAVTGAHEFLGTPAYMSPEQARSGHRDLDTRTDIYSLGVLLYELVAGRTPLDPTDLAHLGPDEVRQRIHEREVPRPSNRFLGLPAGERARVAAARRVDPLRLQRELRGDLGRIVLKALEQDRNRRYESASALAQDLRQWIAHEPVSAVAPSTGYRLRKFARRHRGALAAITGAAALLVGSAALSLGWAWRADHAERQAQALLVTEREVRNQLESLLAELEQARAQATDEAARARAEAATAEAVTRFVNEDLFTAPEAGLVAEREITLRMLLDRASAQLPGALAAQPIVEAAVRTTLARAYRNLGHHPEAESHARSAQVLFEAALGPGHERALRALVELAAILDGSGQPGLAVPAAERARDLAFQHLPATHPLRAESLNRLAASYSRVARTPEARATAAEAWKLACQLDSKTPELLVYAALHLLAREHGTAGRFVEGETLLRRALATHETALGPNHRRTLRVRNNLAAYFTDHRRQLDEAEQLYQQSLLAQSRLLGEEHEFTQMLRLNLGLLYEILDRPEPALAETLAVLEWRPHRRDLATQVGRLLRRARPTSLINPGPEGESPWRYTLRAPPPEWTQPGWQPREWLPKYAEGGATSVWARAEFHLQAPIAPRLALRLEDSGSWEVHLNGELLPRPFIPDGHGGQIAVIPVQLSRALGTGRNVIAAQGQPRALNRPPTIEVIPFAPLGFAQP